MLMPLERLTQNAISEKIGQERTSGRRSNL